MLVVSDADSIGAMLALSERLGRKVGPSTGTHLVAMLTLAQGMVESGESGSILSLLCDSGERYLGTYHDPVWVAQHIDDVTAAHTRWAARLTG